MNFILSKHAEKRMTQRGFSREYLKLFLRLYDQITSSHGADRLHVSRKSIERGWKMASSEEKPLLRQHRQKLLNTMVVVSGQVIVTIYIKGGI